MRTTMPLGLIRFGRIVAMTAVLTALPRTCQAGEAYYVLMLASQTIPNEAKYSHSFATFVRESWPGEGPCSGNSTIESRTISWLPRSGIVRPNALFPECGRNFGLDESILLAEQIGFDFHRRLVPEERS